MLARPCSATAQHRTTLPPATGHAADHANDHNRSEVADLARTDKSDTAPDDYLPPAA